MLQLPVSLTVDSGLLYIVSNLKLWGGARAGNVDQRFYSHRWSDTVHLYIQLLILIFLRHKASTTFNIEVAAEASTYM